MWCVWLGEDEDGEVDEVDEVDDMDIKGEREGSKGIYPPVYPPCTERPKEGRGSAHPSPPAATNGAEQTDFKSREGAMIENEGRHGSGPVRVYVAAPISGREVDYIANIKAITRAAAMLWELGYAVFCPGCDLLLGLARESDPTVEEYKALSMAWLEYSDVVFIAGKKSPGVIAEIKRAGELGIPVCETLEELHAAAAEIETIRRKLGNGEERRPGNGDQESGGRGVGSASNTEDAGV